MMNELIPRDAVKYICRKETVSTNPDDHKHSSQFIDFMDDDAVSDFGRWQWKNGFNTALVAVEIELEKLPSAQPEILACGEGELTAQPEIIRCKNCIYFDRYVDGIEKYQWDGFCADWARNTYEDWFCSRAERRSDG